ncbi:hypothetical protein DU976_15190 [Vibrio navarrensis]|uniref:Uncharacterized protein n=1 Tax=Vibrio navarrensis TaxID=29495 RepID=A0AAI9CWQ1_9VIBR|nr:MULTISPECIES: hypothetical protein [Vibrio harveyi group]EGR2797202.1 hypothetical protein [Vibrio navarrensis]EJL6396775.1 hypothetical protein [Vibrio navarrensis]EKA5638249.1 hypothetical protein [Vibrio navarrensis]ELN6933624.1 hypothetical protein [Vibrio navarrensis]OCP68318.1 hypothetical protein AKH08_16010 [Vibrio parahaemolyticus]
MDSLSVTSSRYTHRQHNQEPLKFFIVLMGLEPYKNDLHRENQSLSLLSGIVLYRHLSKPDQRKVTSSVLNLKNNRLKSKLYGMIGQIVANPYWFCWSLSDSELKSYYNSNKKISDLLSSLGFDVPTISVGVLAAGAYSVFNEGMKTTVTKGLTSIASSNKVLETAKELGLRKRLVGESGRMLGAFVIMIIGFNAMQTKGMKDARKELILRGLINPSEL